MNAIQEAIQHAQDNPKEEVCGLIVGDGTVSRAIRANNLSDEPEHQFTLDPEAWLARLPGERVEMIYHSHVMEPCRPSMVDLAECEKHKLPWLIVNASGDTYTFEPSGFVAPYEQRPYCWGVFDCFTLMQDFHEREFGIHIADMSRSNWYWERGEDLIMENCASRGFIELRDQPPKKGDVFVMQVHSNVPNHLGVYVGDGTILHHAYRRLSVREPYGGMWSKYHYAHLRHKDNHA